MRQIRLIDSLAQTFLKLGRQLKVFVFKSEAYFQKVIKSKLFGEIFAKLGSFELLEEENKYLCKAFGVIVRHGQMSLTFQTADVALEEEVNGKREVLGAVLCHVRHESNFANDGASVCRVIVDGLQCNLDFSRRVILVKVYHL